MKNSITYKRNHCLYDYYIVKDSHGEVIAGLSLASVKEIYPDAVEVK